MLVKSTKFDKTFFLYSFDSKFFAEGEGLCVSFVQNLALLGRLETFKKKMLKCVCLELGDEIVHVNWINNQVKC